MAVRNKWPYSSPKGRTKPEPAGDLPKHLSNLLKHTWHPEGWWRCLCPPTPGTFSLL